MPTFEKSRTELETELREQIDELRARCNSYDSNSHWEAKSIASSAFKLVHDNGKHARSLLGQLGLLHSIEWLSTSWPMDDNPLSSLPLTTTTLCLDGDTVEFEPSFDGKYVPFPMSFGKWWNEPVYRNRRGKTLSRKNLVCTMRNQDGGAHVDGAIRNEAYHWLKSEAEDRVGFELPTRPGESLRCYINYTDDGDSRGATPVNGHRATMRQIGWEIDESLKRFGL